MAVKEKDKKAETANAQPEHSGKYTARWIIGMVILMSGVFAALSVVSYYIHWKSDFSAIHPGEYDEVVSSRVDNICGPTGAHIADALVFRSFGLFGILVPVMAIMLGLRILRRRSIFLHHWNLNCALILIFGSLTLGLAFGKQWGIFGSGWGGGFGVFVAEKLVSSIGYAGAIIAVVAGWIFTGVSINRSFINTVNTAGTAVADKGEALWVTLRKSLNFKRKPKKNEFEQFLETTEQRTITLRGDSVEPDEKKETFEEFDKTDIKNEIEKDNAADDSRDEHPSDDEPQTPENDADDSKSPFVEDDEPQQGNDAADTEDEVDSPVEEETPPQKKGKFEEFDTDNDEPQQGGISKIVVEEHHEQQVHEHEIGSLYDPMEDIPNYRRPSPELLEEHASNSRVTDEEITYNKQRIEQTLAHFGIPICDMKATVGPTVTLYEIVQEQGVKIAKIRSLENDIAQSLKASGIRIIAPIPGRGTIGIEVPNRDKDTVSMRSAILSKRFQQFEGELPVVIGRTIQNENYVFDLAKMPHLLVAGATGKGKSVGLNAIIASLLYRKHPAQLKFVMIDPKQVEFSLYSKIERHFLAKMASEEESIITDARKAVCTLQALCMEMDQRLKLCKLAQVRNIQEYNDKFTARKLNPLKGHRYLPYIVVIIDEFADLITNAKEVEMPVARLTAVARAAGIHLIIATQRPSVNVITGKIKANCPSRIAFQVTQMNDSRTIIDRQGAEHLIGRGDMLFSKDGELTRIQCAFIDTPEVEKIVEAIASQPGYPQAYPLPDYEEAGSTAGDAGGNDLGGGTAIKYDALFAEIAREAVSGGQISTSFIQRNYEVGFNRAGRIMTQLERAGIVGPQFGAKPREVKFYDLQSLEAKLQELGLS